MSKIAAHCPKAVDERMASSRLRPLPALAGALVLAGGLASLPTHEAAAQSRSGIVINNDVLNSLGPGPEAAPLAPLAPDAPPTPLSPRSRPSAVQAPLAPPPMPGGGNADAGFQAYGDGNYVVTRPGTLLFPPPQAPDSTLTPGFAGTVDNEAARARALDNAFAEGPEPSSQLLIPLDGRPEMAAGMNAGQSAGNDSVLVFMENLPELEEGADRSAAPVLTLQAPPQPSPPKPAVPPAALANVQPPVETTPLAPEFVAAEPPAEEPELAEVGAEPDVPAAETPVAETDIAEAKATVPEVAAVAEPEAESDVDETPEPELAEAPAEALPESDAASTAEPLASAETLASGETLASAEAAADVQEDAPVSLLPRNQVPAQDDTRTAAPAAGLQTASLSVGSVEDRSFLFEVDSAELTPEVESDLRALAEALRGTEAGDIQVLGFASGQDSGDDQARKLALSRALKVRSFLIDAGIPSARIRVRSLGDRADGGPANRVDIRPIGS